MIEKAVSGSAKSLEDLHKRTFEIIERERKKEEEQLETGVIDPSSWRKDKHGWGKRRKGKSRTLYRDFLFIVKTH